MSFINTIICNGWENQISAFISCIPNSLAQSLDGPRRSRKTKERKAVRGRGYTLTDNARPVNQDISMKCKCYSQARVMISIGSPVLPWTCLHTYIHMCVLTHARKICLCVCGSLLAVPLKDALTYHYFLFHSCPQEQ